MKYATCSFAGVRREYFNGREQKGAPDKEIGGRDLQMARPERGKRIVSFFPTVLISRVDDIQPPEHERRCLFNFSSLFSPGSQLQRQLSVQVSQFFHPGGGRKSPRKQAALKTIVLKR